MPNTNALKDYRKNEKFSNKSIQCSLCKKWYQSAGDEEEYSLENVCFGCSSSKQTSYDTKQYPNQHGKFNGRYSSRVN